MNARIRIVVTGRVQGVGYRFACRNAAARLGLRGWVKNLDDGGVEIVAEGGQAALDLLLAWCRRGPFGAAVSDCRAETQQPSDEFESFDIRF